MSLQDIPVVPFPADTAGSATLNVKPLLHEIKFALEKLANTGKPTTIDLGGIPLTPGENRELRNILGEGEVNIQIDALGPSHIHETAYAGVWWVEHFNRNNEMTGRYIEVTRIPSLVTADADEIGPAKDRLQQFLSEYE